MGEHTVMKASRWIPFDDGSTIGKAGTEGIIIQDHHLPGEARTTLEKRAVGYAVTSGIYGWMVTTTFLAEEEAADLYPKIQAELQRIVDIIPLEEDTTEEKIRHIEKEISRFVGRP